MDCLKKVVRKIQFLKNTILKIEPFKRLDLVSPKSQNFQVFVNPQDSLVLTKIQRYNLTLLDVQENLIGVNPQVN